MEWREREDVVVVRMPELVDVIWKERPGGLGQSRGCN